MHRNTILSFGLVLVTVALLLICSCNGDSNGNKDLTGLQGVWDYTASGTAHVTNYYSVGPKKLAWTGVYSITPEKITDRQGYDWTWNYDGQLLLFKFLKAIPVTGSSKGPQIIDGYARFDMPMTWGATSSTGLMTLDQARIHFEDDTLEGNVTGSFSIVMTKRAE